MILLIIFIINFSGEVWTTVWKSCDNWEKTIELLPYQEGMGYASMMHEVEEDHIIRQNHLNKIS